MNAQRAFSFSSSVPIQSASKLAHSKAPFGRILCGIICVAMHSALDEAHRNHLLHRDLKHGNIMVTRSGTVKQLALGLAKLSARAESATASAIEGTVMGTPACMSPEQAQGKPVEERAITATFLYVLPLFDPLRSHPRYHALLRKMNILVNIC